MIKGTLVYLLLLTSQVFAQAGKGISFQAFIKSPTGIAVNATGLTINAKILAPNGCILREESFTNIDIVNGYLNVIITKGTVGGADQGLSILKVFDNTPTAITGLICINTDGSVNGTLTSYTPTSNHARKLRISTTIGADTIVAEFNLRSVPFATNSETVNGKLDTDFVNINSSQNLTQSNVESVFNRFTKLDSLLNNFNTSGTSAGINITGNAATATTASNVTGTVAVANGGTGGSNASVARANLGLGTISTLSLPSPVDATKVLKGDGTWGTVAGSGTVTGITAGTGLTGGTINSNGTIAVDVGTTANKIVQLDGSGKLPAVDGSALTNITTTIDSIVNATAKYFDYKPNNVACGNGEILKYSTGTGWICSTLSSSGAVTSVSAALTAGNPITVSGTSVITIDIPVATSVANGYLKSSDWSTFNGKQVGSSELSGLVTGMVSTGIVQRTAAGAYTTLGTSSPLSVVAGNISLGTVPVASGGTGTTTGSITGTGALTLAAGGTNQNITLDPSGTGYTILNGNVGIGNTNPTARLHIGGTAGVDGIKFPDGTIQTTAATGGSWSAVTSNITAVAGGKYLVDTSSGAITITLPVSPSLGDEIVFVDAASNFATNNLTVGRNSLKIMGLVEDMTVSSNNASFTLIYYNAANGWRIK